MRTFVYLSLLMLPVLLGACGEKQAPCFICYEDEWSREPFPGQPKQHIKPLTPEDVQSGRGSVPTEFLGVVSSSEPGEGRW